MKLKLTLITSILIYSHLPFCQPDYFIYHQIINSAEERISTEEFSEALVLYDSAFILFEYVFVKDYIIAAQLAALIDDRSKCMNYMEEAMRGGYKSYCFEQMPPIKQILNDLDWKEIKHNESRLRNEYLSSINRELSYEFSRRYREEQDNKNGTFGERIIRLNYDRIVSLMDTYLFLSERVVGLDDSDLDSNSRNTPAELIDCSAGNSKVLVTLLHSKDPISHFGFAYLLDAVAAGYLHPRELAALYEYSPTRDEKWDWNGIKLFERPELKFRRTTTDQVEDLSLINADRGLIGLGTQEIEFINTQVAFKYLLRLRFDYK